MKKTFFILSLLMIVLAAFSACTGKAKKRSDFASLQMRFHKSFSGVFDDMETQHRAIVDKLKAGYKTTSKTCDKKYLKNKSKSTFYAPKFARNNAALPCFAEISTSLEDTWQSHSPETTSWQYVFDRESKGLRIYPQQNAEVIYGDNLDFEKFNFVRKALAAEPNLVWTGVHNDAAGTGKIIMITQSVAIDSSRKSLIVAADLRVSRLLQIHSNWLLDFANRAETPHAFLYAFHKGEDMRTGIYDFSSNRRLWESIKPLTDGKLRIKKAAIKKISRMEKESEKNPSKTVSSEIEMEGIHYFCNMSGLKNAPIFVLACMRE